MIGGRLGQVARPVHDRRRDRVPRASLDLPGDVARLTASRASSRSIR
ncbi:MAG: hypothetical protein AVDCRST_MAG85-491 [uncultured Solirubrobacteraceae bacterium]|uniref:Uncharacterized protein n=1 Tax=uncultured Solirubrobacteraceae bacterium TaxID=1162706 RepID=A0A6J4RQ30_9ACTN|nr:MAG: hypothetical protein AVDCRST_MAG85-491 [uncultured Solirubrobacteraceae bacterium]